MIKKKYIKPSMFAKEARTLHIIEGSTEGEGSDQSAGNGEHFDANQRYSSSLDEWNAIWTN